MSKLFSHIFPAILVALSVTVVSCRQEEAPRTIENPETPVAVKVAPEEPLLLAASTAKVQINGAQQTRDDVVVIFAAPFTYEGREYNEVKISSKYIKSFTESSVGVVITFFDGKFVTFLFQKEVSLDIDGELSFKDYPEVVKSLPFKVTKAGRGDISFSVKGENGFTPKVSYSDDSRSGTISFSFSGEPGQTDKASVIMTDGKAISTYTLTATTYAMSITAEDITLGGTEGSSATLSYTVQTDVADVAEYEVTLTAAGGFFSLSGNTVTALSDNNASTAREGTITVTASVSSLKATAVVKVLQEALPVPPVTKPDCVPFADVAFKNACLRIADQDKDGEVSYSEAEAVEVLEIAGKGIKDLTGLEYFKNVWKLDAQNNDITDGTLIKNLPLLYWLDLKGNKNLKTFDVTGCCVYFEHCEFDVSDDLVYYAHRYQYGVGCVSDPYYTHSPDLADNSVTTDWSAHKRMTLVHRHTKTINSEEMPWIDKVTMEGMVPSVVFTGMGFIDKDINDGSWDRLFKQVKEYYLNDVLKDYLDYLDVYELVYLQDNRDKFYFEPNSPYLGEECASARALLDAEYKIRDLYAYETLYGDTEGQISSFLGRSKPSRKYPAQLIVDLNLIPVRGVLVPNNHATFDFLRPLMREAEASNGRAFQFTMAYSTESRAGVKSTVTLSSGERQLCDILRDFIWDTFLVESRLTEGEPYYLP